MAVVWVLAPTCWHQTQTLPGIAPYRTGDCCLEKRNKEKGLKVTADVWIVMTWENHYEAFLLTNSLQLYQNIKSMPEFVNISILLIIFIAHDWEIMLLNKQFKFHLIFLLILMVKNCWHPIHIYHLYFMIVCFRCFFCCVVAVVHHLFFYNSKCPLVIYLLLFVATVLSHIFFFFWRQRGDLDEGGGISFLNVCWFPMNLAKWTS